MGQAKNRGTYEQRRPSARGASMTPLTDEQASTLLRDMERWRLSRPGEASAAAFERIKLTVQSLIAQAEAAAVERCAVEFEDMAEQITAGGMSDFDIKIVLLSRAATIRSLTNPKATDEQT